MPKSSGLLTVFAVLFVILAISNFGKPLQLSSETGFVLFGTRLDGAANAAAGTFFGMYLGVYAWGIWHMKRFALPMGVAYAAYVVGNLFLFTLLNPLPGGMGNVVFGLVYTAVAVGVSAGAAWLLYDQRIDLG